MVGPSKLPLTKVARFSTSDWPREFMMVVIDRIDVEDLFLRLYIVSSIMIHDWTNFSCGFQRISLSLFCVWYYSFPYSFFSAFLPFPSPSFLVCCRSPFDGRRCRPSGSRIHRGIFVLDRRQLRVERDRGSTREHFLPVARFIY